MEYLVYLAGPITGLSYKEAKGWRDYVTERLAFKTRGRFSTAISIETISPLRGKDSLDIDIPIGAWAMSDVTRRDFFDIRRSDLVLVNFLDAEKVSQGSLVEIGYAVALNKPLVVVMDMKNIHNHPFVVESALVITGDLDKAIDKIVELCWVWR